MNVISILEKDGATIITIENPTGEEQSLINRAKSARRSQENGTGAYSSVWSKFRCNQNTAQNNAVKVNTDYETDENGFVEIISLEEDVPF